MVELIASSLCWHLISITRTIQTTNRIFECHEFMVEQFLDLPHKTQTEISKLPEWQEVHRMVKSPSDVGIYERWCF